MLSVAFSNYYAECLEAECRQAEYRGANFSELIMTILQTRKIPKTKIVNTCDIEIYSVQIVLDTLIKCFDRPPARHFDLNCN